MTIDPSHRKKSTEDGALSSRRSFDIDHHFDESDRPARVISATDNTSTRKTWRFWAILLSLGITGMLSALEGTIITSALPAITEALGGGNSYIWVPNAYLLASVATLPLFAQVSNIFGRRNLLLIAVALFVLGSGLSGGASSMAMLIAARTIQGLGGGGINLLIETVVTDLVPLRERGKYMSLVMIGATIGATLGPFLGGIITDNSTWRWVFYLNLPIGSVAFLALFMFLRVNYKQDTTWRQRFRRIDLSGNLIFIGAVISVLIAVTWGGTAYEWKSFRVIVPLLLGFFGIALFTAFEWSPKLCPEPSFPRMLVSNRTSAAALGLTFIHAIVTYWTYYFLPIYFQSVKRQSAMHSGIDTLPTFAGGLIFALVGGVLLSKLGRYKPLHIAGFAVFTIAFGLLSLLDAKSNPAAWVFFQLIAASGSGVLVGILLPAVQAPLDQSLVATSTGVWSFARYFGCIWGVTIPSVIFNNQCAAFASGLSDQVLASKLTGGQAYQHATAAFIDSITDPALQEEVVQVFASALRVVWLVGIAFAGVGLLLVFLEKEVSLSNSLNTEFGIEGTKKSDDPVGEREGAIEMTPVQAAITEAIPPIAVR
ncbi:hypothetical protein B0A48_02180 [Cryoendolithus antarcticus]|uniref:Major facilitator superfamily (MFS) profile domain-containing protein n=1 Tax=Cryoendolithus antarcticus TaxID=1507870 RepID=A0A1V8TMW5_9PEZI|nr:hypothetical protein B0A48_02180 [Cryoendolithus antarcticus]